MNNKIKVAGFGLLTLLSGCVMVPYGTTPKAEEVDKKNVPLSERKSIAFERQMEVIIPGIGNTEHSRQYWGAFDDRAMRSAARHNPHIGVLEPSTSSNAGRDDLSLRIDGRYTLNTTGAFFTGLTLMIVPFPCFHSWQYDFTVRDASGRAAQYHFEDGWREHIGPLTLFFVPWYDQSYETVANRVLGNVYDQLFLSMERDGFFDKSPLPATAKPVATASELVGEPSETKQVKSVSESRGGERQKELKQLLDAGVISEEEYRREVEKVVNFNKGGKR